MYEAPKRFRASESTELVASGADARDDGEAGGSLRLADGPEVRNAQLLSRGQFAPYFAAANVVGALGVGYALIDATPLWLVAGWGLLVVAVNVLLMRNAESQAVLGLSRMRRKADDTGLIVNVVGRGALWCSLPLYAFPGQSPEVQMVIGTVMAAMTGTAIAYASVPVAATAWLLTMCGGLSGVLFLAHGSLSLVQKAALVLIAGMGIGSVVRISRWAFKQIEMNAKVGSKSEEATLLLKEYEQRGAGWLWQVDAENRVTYISSRMTAMIGKSTGQLTGHSLPASLGGMSNLGQALLAREPFSALEMEIKTPGGPRWISIAGDPIVGANGQFEGFRGVGSDITDVRRTQERLTNLANVDVLSGLPNRGRVRQLLGEALSTSIKSQVPCAILFLDLDGFKPVNDTYGHPAGDAVLKSVAQRLVKEAEDFGTVGRMGGDEFAIVIRDAQSRKSVENLADRIIEAIGKPYRLDKMEIRIGISVGCAYGPMDGQSVDDLILKADLALYEAKGQGRGRVCYFSANLQNEAEDRVRVENDLRAALKGDQFHLLYQPLIDAQTQTLLGFEALLRWNHPERGVVPPNIFIPIAEESNLIVAIGEWVINEGCRAAASWPEHITVAMNLSPRQLVIPALPNTVGEALARHRLPGNRIELEVTESVFMDGSDGSLDVLKRLRTLGVGIALDDFGTGYSSLGYLNKAVFHKLKIDGSFVREAGTRPETIEIIKSIVQLARSFRLNVTAEGIETVEDFERMRELGCNTMQGYLFGRPMPYARANELVMGQARRKAG
ncbi:MAG TPA: EAL domain-containing protein [Sphingomonadaceae bacterium]|nr:EAL domain-containing protein [Sphingomonadaceae bacterium]